MNDFLEWIGKNRAVFIAAAVALMTVAVVTGVLVGTAERRKTGAVGPRETDMSDQDLDRIASPELLLPAPVVPSLYEDNGYSYYYDRYYDIERQTFIPLTASGLLAHLPGYETEGIKPLSVRGMEFEVLTLSDELAEP
ncbi:MAG: hypothetical protein JXQ30_09330 [Spirochaetes bacterium]|nr:hypothetical protein [Spirochaetota bacterium]